MTPLTLTLLLLAGCAHTGTKLQVQTGGELLPAFTEAPADALAPNPFTVDQLREGLVVGLTFRYQKQAVGADPTQERWTIKAATEQTVTINTAQLDANGAVIHDDGDETFTWEELHHHADFPASDTVREGTKVTVPAGIFQAWHYVVRNSAEDQVSRFHFAKDQPGPPLKFTIQQGKGMIYEMILLERTAP